MKIYYGYGHPIEIDDEWEEILLAEDRQITNNNKKESRRHCSLDSYNLDDAMLPSKVDVPAEVIMHDEIERLLACLLPEQRKLVRQIFMEGYRASEIATTSGVDNSAISHKLDRAKKRIKNSFK